MSKEKILKRIDELKLRLEKCKDEHLSLQCGLSRLEDMMAVYIREIKILEIPFKGDASAIMDRE